MIVAFERLINKLRIAYLRFRGCTIGSNCTIEKNVSILGFSRLKIGNNVKIESNVRFKIKNYSNNDNKFQLIIEDNVFIGYGVIFDVNSQIRVESNCMFGPYSFITDSNHVHNLNDQPFSNLGGIYKNVHIESNCWIGCHCIILPGVIIGKNSIIAANSVVNNNVNRSTLNAGSPSKEKIK